MNNERANGERLDHKSVSPRTRKLILERDNHTCQDCGYTGRDSYLRIHHILAVRYWGNDDHENLTTLCCRCHFKADRKIWVESMQRAQTWMGIRIMEDE